VVKVRDLSYTMKNYSMEPNEVKITHMSHAESQRRQAKRVGLRTDQVAPFGANDHVITLSHAGTHVDAPWHFGPTSEGKPSKKIDQVPLEWCFGDGVLLDFSQTKKPGEAISTEDLKKELQRIGYNLKPMDVVMIRTGAEDYEDDPKFAEMASGLVKESLYWLLDQGIKLIGTDAYTLDIPIPRMVEELKKGNKSAFFPVHYAGRDREYIHAEKLSNLKTLPRPYGFKVAMFPIKIEEGAGGWARAVAIEGEEGAPKKPEILDLSVPIMSQAMERYDITVDHITHEEGARRLAKRYGISLKLLPTGDLYANDEVSCSSHAGTHVDAPWHFGPVVEGKPAKTIDRVPLEWCYGDGVLLDFSHKKACDPITAIDLMKELERIGYQLKPRDILLIRTGAEDHFFDDPNFSEVATGLSGDALMWLYDRGVIMTGTDSFTMDISIDIMCQKLKGGDTAAYFPVHKGSIVKDSCHAEKLYNLKKLPRPFGFKVAMFPIKLENCAGAWTRAVAFL